MSMPWRWNPVYMLVFALILGWSSLAAAGETVEVTVKGKSGFKFEPSTVEVPAGGRVKLTFANVDTMGHSLKVPELNAGTKTIGPDKRETITFTVGDSGSYEFICGVAGHAKLGMKGSLKIK